MAFLKLDCGILDSTLWFDRDGRDVFITALLMAHPFELQEPTPQLEVCSLSETGWIVPAGQYGFVEAAGIGIVKRAGVEHSIGLTALERLGSPELDSRNPAFDGRRLVRVDGGFIALNFWDYRTRDHTAAERSRRYRERKKRHGVASHSHTVTPRSVTQAEAEAEAEVEMVSSVEIQKGGKDQDRAGVSNLPIRRPPDPTDNHVALQRLLNGETHLAIPTEKATRGREARQLLEHRAEFVFRYACARWGKTKGYRLDDKRRRRLMTRLNEADGEMTDLLYAADGAKLDPWISGLDPQSTKDFLTIDTVYRDRGQVERLRDLVKDVQEKHPIEVEGEAVAQ